jgi:hypothetical protein
MVDPTHKGTARVTVNVRLHSMPRIFIVVIILLAVEPATGACLHGQLSVTDEYTKSHGVLIGRVISSEPVGESKDYLDGYIYTVKVKEKIRGNVADPLILFSENSSGRFPMSVGIEYVLFVYEALGRTMVDNCGNSGPLSEKKDVARTVRRLK